MTPDARAARERKQKIFVAVGGVFLLVLLAIQAPKLLHRAGGSPAAVESTITTPISAAKSVATAANAGSATPVALVAAAHPGLPTTGKLRSFAFFKRKDPFLQQVAVTPSTTAPSLPSGSATTTSRTGKTAKTASGAAKKFTLGTKSAASPALSIVSVNGDRQALEAGARFPASDPVFVLVAEHPESKSVEIGVVGGSYKGGSKTTKLAVGKPLTLVNTTTGARYRVVLVAVGNGGSAKPASTK